jgi:hypothetical protein
MTLITALGLSLVIAPTAQAKAKVTKPSAPTISAISSSTPKKGKVNVTVTITLPASNGGSKITGSKVSAGGKTCTIKKTKTSCTIKSIKNDKTLIVTAKSKNINGFSSASEKVTYVAGSDSYTRANVVVVTPVASSPVASSPVASSPVATDTTISVAAIAGVTAPVQGATPVTTTTAGTGYTGTVTWSGTPASFALATTYTATITLTPTSGYTLTGVTANFFTVAGATTDTNSANSGVITAVFPATASTYAVGNTGPGGGIIYYVDSTGFSCGASYSATGSPAGGLCNYLEVAPNGWSGGADSGAISGKPWATELYQNADILGITNDASAYNNALGIGLGYKNSVLIVAQNGTYDATSNNYSAGAVRAYTNNSKTDWYLPTTAELNLLCQWNRGVTQNVTTPCTGGVLNSGTGASGSGIIGMAYRSSSEVSAGHAWHQFINSGLQNTIDKSWNLGVRPIRAF